MKVGRDEVMRVARLVELGVPEESVDRLAQDIGRIVEYVSQLTEVELPQDGLEFIPGPQETPLREDRVRPDALGSSPREMAPEFVDGFFVVPRLEAMDDEA